MTAGGAGIGGVAKALRGKRALEVKVRVTAAPWVAVDELEVRRAKGPSVTRPLALVKEKSGALAQELTVSIPVDKDDAFVVIARGTKPLTPVLAGEAREISPWAMTGAIWVDADGDGRSLGR